MTINWGTLSTQKQEAGFINHDIKLYEKKKILLISSKA